jgi:hypothetical protein
MARLRDKTASARVLRADDECAGCGGRATNAHHVVPRSAGGDDVDENLLPVCGSGTTGCHGAYHAGDEDVRRALGEAIALRPAMMSYVMFRLGDDVGREFLRRRYFIEEGTCRPDPSIS